MEITVTKLRLADIDAAHDRFAHTSESGPVRKPGVGTLDIEAVASNPLFPPGPKWGIRFSTGGIVTIILGMRNYGRGCYTAYFAGLVAARLGIPFRRLRVYYSANLPAALQTPVQSSIVPHRSNTGPVAQAAADVIEEMCDQVIERARSVFAAMAGVRTIDVGFDQPTGRFFVVSRDRSRSVLELAGRTPRGACVSSGFAKESLSN
jgi:CO/xanthine dehydrogenase Mo-binding subunit